MKPPDIRQNAVISSDGGRDGEVDRAGAMYSSRYVTPLMAAAAVRKLPNCKLLVTITLRSTGKSEITHLCIIVDVTVS